MEIPRIKVRTGGHGNINDIVRKWHKHQNKDGSFNLELNSKYEYYKKKGSAFLDIGEPEAFEVKEVEPLIVSDERINKVESDRKLFSGLKNSFTSVLSDIRSGGEEEDHEGNN